MINGRKPSRIPESDRFTLRHLLAQGYSGREIRYLLLSRHYRKPIFFSRVRLDMARNTLRHLDDFIQRLYARKDGPEHPEMDQLIYDLKHCSTESMDDDLNVAPAMAALFSFTSKVNRIMDRNGLARSDKKKILDVLESINSVLQILDLRRPMLDEKLQELMTQRQKAREQRNWELADRLRQELRGVGIELVDTCEGTVWRRRRDLS